MSAGYPNMFAITGLQSPSVLANMPVAIEQHVESIWEFVQYMRDNGLSVVEPTREAKDEWVEHSQEVAYATLLPESATWYMGANIPGKEQVFLPHVGGLGPYRQKCDEVAANGYEGFAFANRGATDLATKYPGLMYGEGALGYRHDIFDYQATG